MKKGKRQPHYKKKGALYKFLHFWIKVFLPKNEVIWQTEKPADGEPTVYICNHTKIYAPVFFLSQDKPLRTWVNCYFFTKDMCWKLYMAKKANIIQERFMKYASIFT